jgi:hypothetical protein
MSGLSIDVDGDVRDVVLMMQLRFMVGKGPVNEVLDLERPRSVHVNSALVICRAHYLAIVTVHPAGVSVKALENF